MDKIGQADRILGILQDGKWHTGLQFVRLARPILCYTKRISELRREGWDIQIERREGLWRYQLKDKKPSTKPSAEQSSQSLGAGEKIISGWWG